MNRRILIATLLAAGFLLAGAGLVTAGSATASLGHPAPDFNLRDTNGNEVKLSEYKGKIVVLEWINPDCPFVQRHYNNETMKKLADKYRDQDVVWLAVNSTHYMDAANNKQWAERFKLPYPILDDKTGTVGETYGAKTTPHLFIVDRMGKLVYDGAIDDDPRGQSQSPLSYVDSALQQLVKGAEVEVTETRPYGCSVKYKK
ncbi:MAG: thioredoxin family protein [Acidobacteria bacterium]|nr:thioredoxin family protein [Acidobacteriota bacterium]